jgi:predicted RecB family nuclease
LTAIRCTIDDAVERAEAIARGDAATLPFFSASCARCRWRDECLPRLEAARDLSFVYGLTRSRHRVLRGRGVATIDDLADADLSRLIAEGVPSEGLERTQTQARALLAGRALRTRAVPLPQGARRELYLRIEIDPLDRGEPFSIGWGEGPSGGGSIDVARVVVASTAAERAEALKALVEVVESAPVRDEPIYVFGAGTAQAFDVLAEASDLAPARAGDLAGRFVDLAPWVRRAGVLPVFLYRFDEVAAVARDLPRPSPGVADDALFVLHAGLAAAEDPEGLRLRLDGRGLEALESLRAIRAWLAHEARAGEPR